MVCRFAPSPTGDLHLGHAYSAWLNREAARLASGRFLLRIEDIDFTRCRPNFTASLLADLDWLGLKPEPPPLVQSRRRLLYRHHIEALAARNLAYPCFCTRADRQSDEGRHAATCKHLSATERARKITVGTPYALRLDMAAVAQAYPDLCPTIEHGLVNDAIIARKDIGVSYLVAVVVDDMAQGITHVIRGRDLVPETIYQQILFRLFGSPAPRYYHHSLMVDETGTRLAKSRGSKTLRHHRADGPNQLLDQLRQKAIASGDLKGLQAFLTQDSPP